MVFASVCLAEYVVVKGSPCNIESVAQLMDTKRIARSMIELLKGGELLLQGHAGQIPGLADDLHVMFQLLQATGNGIKFSGVEVWLGALIEQYSLCHWYRVL